jgi:mercuric ion binding protein
MKSRSYLFICLTLLFISFSTFAQQSKSEDIKVWGNCGMCKSTIEKAAKSAGATDANWNEDTKILTVSYDASNSGNQKIQKAVAAAGYDTQDLTAPEDVYNKLHGCCKYDRKPAAVNAQVQAMTAAGSTASKCCDMPNCGKGADCCKDMKCCEGKSCAKDMSCCKEGKCEKGKDAKGMSCCKDDKQGKGKHEGTAMAACKDKSCCKS